MLEATGERRPTRSLRQCSAGGHHGLPRVHAQHACARHAGDLIVRPTPFESSLIQAPLGSNPLHHLLSGYQASLTAVRICARTHANCVR